MIYCCKHIARKSSSALWRYRTKQSLCLSFSFSAGAQEVDVEREGEREREREGGKKIHQCLWGNGEQVHFLSGESVFELYLSWDCFERNKGAGKLGLAALGAEVS